MTIANPWPFGELVPMSYDLLVLDIPWPFDLYSNKGNKKSAAAHYKLMTRDEIMTLPVDRLAQKDCMLLLWVTAPQLGFALSAMQAWGFTYKSNMVWRKTTAAGKVRMGPGYWCRTMHEQILIGTFGKPGKLSAFPSIFDGVAREHSRKPEEFYALVERHTSGLRRADVFARASRPDWDSFGDERTKFDTGVAA